MDRNTGQRRRLTSTRKDFVRCGGRLTFSPLAPSLSPPDSSPYHHLIPFPHQPPFPHFHFPSFAPRLIFPALSPTILIRARDLPLYRIRMQHSPQSLKLFYVFESLLVLSGLLGNCLYEVWASGHQGFNTRREGKFVYRKICPRRRCCRSTRERCSTTRSITRSTGFPREKDDNWKANARGSSASLLQAPQRITHWSKMREAQTRSNYFCKGCDRPRRTTRPGIVQLPPTFRRTPT